MFFSSQLYPKDLVETINSQDVIKSCAEILRTECIDQGFLLEGSYKDPDDVIASYNIFTDRRPPSWERFLNTILPFRKTSEAFKRKCDTIFQIIYSLVHNSTKTPPLHVVVAETIHDLTREISTDFEYNKAPHSTCLLPSLFVVSSTICRIG